MQATKRHKTLEFLLRRLCLFASRKILSVCAIFPERGPAAAGPQRVRSKARLERIRGVPDGAKLLRPGWARSVRSRLRRAELLVPFCGRDNSVGLRRFGRKGVQRPISPGSERPDSSEWIGQRLTRTLETVGKDPMDGEREPPLEIGPAGGMPFVFERINVASGFHRRQRTCGSGRIYAHSSRRSRVSRTSPGRYFWFRTGFYGASETRRPTHCPHHVER